MRRGFVGSLLKGAVGLAALTAAATTPTLAQDTIKVGVLHSLSGTMAISETTLKDVMLVLVEEQNKKGGLLGKKLEAVVVDLASNWPLFAEKARELITKHKVADVFGCWTSVSRKSVLPVFKELNNILFYPVQYEGEESERNVFYTGAAPNQQAIPAIDYLMSKEGGEVKRWVLAGADYVYPRTTNKILEVYLLAKGMAKEDIMINYTPFGHSDWQTIVAEIKKFGSTGKKTAVVSTINGDANVPFYKELANQGIKATDIPVVASSVGKEELAGIDTKDLVGHLAAGLPIANRLSHGSQASCRQDHCATISSSSPQRGGLRRLLTSHGQEIADLGAALQPSAERFLEATQQGRSFLQQIAAAWPVPDSKSLLAPLERENITHSVAVGLTASFHDIPLADTLRAYAIVFARI